MGSPRPNDYLLLGVSPRATRAELLSAFRRRARAVHPDIRPDDPEAQRQFQELRAAYEALARAMRTPTVTRRIPVVVRPGSARRPEPPLRAMPAVVRPFRKGGA